MCIILFKYWDYILPILFGAIIIIFFIDYLQTLFLLLFRKKTKEIMDFNIEINEFKNDFTSVKKSIQKYNKGTGYYYFLEKSNIFKY